MRSLYILIDGAFLPGLFRQLHNSHECILLFESLPGCDEETRDVSPFLTPYDPRNESLLSMLVRCEGQPMLSVIQTSERLDQLSQRLAAWCVVQADGSRFNFCFADTRRIPAIIEVLTSVQRKSLTGPATNWHYIGRNGCWWSLPLESENVVVNGLDRAELNDVQFMQLIEDSEVDEVWSRLQYQGISWPGMPSERYRILAQAIAVARTNRLDETLLLPWCGKLLEDATAGDVCSADSRFSEWMGRLAT